MMNWICFFLALISLGAGLYAAYLWWLASKVPVFPAWELAIVEHEEANTMSHVAGLMIAFNRSSKLNANAALWTAIAVATGSVGTLVPETSR